MVLFRTNKYTPRWIVFALDLGISFTSLILAYLTRFNFMLPTSVVTSLIITIPVVLLVRAASFVIFKSYAGLVRFTSAKDTERVILVVLSGSVMLAFINLVTYVFNDGAFLVPFSVLVIELLATAFIMVTSRLLVKAVYYEIVNPAKMRSNVIIFGADEFGAITKRTLDRDSESGKKVVAFIDYNRNNVGKKLDGIQIYHTSELNELLNKYIVSSLVITRKKFSSKLKDSIIKTCLEHDIKIQRVPEISKWINGELSYNQIKSVKIEELLEREPINLNKTAISKVLIDKVVMVSGAAGSIGSEIVRQVSKFHPRKIVLVDIAESPLYDLELEMSEKFHFNDFAIELSNITDKHRMQYIFDKYKPSIVYHAAAYKHVPMMESHPFEAVNTNVGGTKLLADLSHRFGVDKFVMVSTDKAVNPTNVMGASKRIAEKYIQALNNNSETLFITTRFGNVLGSNGSVIPRFKKQIEEGGPVTITDPNVTRFFMTIPEACQLVLEASAMGEGGEIFLFDMGKSVRISDLAKKMIRLAGLVVGRDIQIVYTGLRPGEKLYEELLTKKENTLPTYHDKIMRAKVQYHDYNTVKKQIQSVLESISDNNKFSVVKEMKKIVPEFKSRNSVFEKLDIETSVDENI